MVGLVIIKPIFLSTRKYYHQLNVPIFLGVLLKSKIFFGAITRSFVAFLSQFRRFNNGFNSSQQGTIIALLTIQHTVIDNPLINYTQVKCLPKQDHGTLLRHAQKLKDGRSSPEFLEQDKKLMMEFPLLRDCAE